MKLKDIKVGEEYAVAAPAAKRARWNNRPRRDWFSRVRVTKVGVRGGVRGDTYSGVHRSVKSDYVEFEYVDDSNYRRGEQYETSWVTGTEEIPSRWGGETRKTDRRRRCMASHVFSLWAPFAEEEERFVKQHEANEREAEEKVDEARAIVDQLARLGVSVSRDGSDFKLSKGHAEALIVRLTS